MSGPVSVDELFYCLTCACPQYEFSDKEIDAMRRRLAAQWSQSISQVTEYEAVYYLRGGK
jgi:hypothetical protein